MPYLTSGEADRLCSVIQSCDLSFKRDHLDTETPSQPGKYISSQNEDNSDNHLPGSTELESLKEDWRSYSSLVDKHRTKMKELLPCLQGKSQNSSMEESLSEGETTWLWKDAMNDKVTFQKKLHEAELAIGSAELFLPSFRETLVRISKSLRTEVTQKERHLLELSSQLHQEKTVEKKIAEWKLQVVEHKQQILAEKGKREERRNALKRAASVQKQRAEHLKAVVETLISKIGDKEIQLSEALSASNVWKSHHETVVDEKTRLEVQVESLKKQVADHMMELRRIQDAERKSRSEIIGKLNAIVSENEKISLENTTLKASLSTLEISITSTEVELVDLREEAQQQEMLVEQYKSEVVRLDMEAEELKTKYENILSDSGKIMEDKDFEMNAMRDQTEAYLKELECARDMHKAVEGKLQTCQESLLSCQKSCVDKSKAIRELQVQVGDSGGVLEQLSLEEENRNIQLKYEEVKKKLEEMELQNNELENQLANKEEILQKTEFQFNQKIADCEALTRQLEAALEDGRKKLAEEMEKITSKEQAFQLKILDLENKLRKKKEEQKQLSRRLEAREKHHEVSLKELEHSLQRSENQTQSIQNYVKFLKTSYVTMFG
ncbi:protein BCAP isoform X5 [Sceloporus undulatus]|uniref:protein BCAP isoform X5 n=1 Tax=Sceloporus undulatus TaxID=8520 RepID=UPI001C4AC9D4|nr:protein BCAP isoform X5 [Sceloporus undulatus]